MAVIDICVCVCTLSLRLLTYFILDVLFWSRRLFLFLLFVFPIIVYYIYVTLNVSPCSHRCQRSFPTGTKKLKCIVLYYRGPLLPLPVPPSPLPPYTHTPAPAMAAKICRRFGKHIQQRIIHHSTNGNSSGSLNPGLFVRTLSY